MRNVESETDQVQEQTSRYHLALGWHQEGLQVPAPLDSIVEEAEDRRSRRTERSGGGPTMDVPDADAGWTGGLGALRRRMRTRSRTWGRSKGWNRRRRLLSRHPCRGWPGSRAVCATPRSMAADPSMSAASIVALWNACSGTTPSLINSAIAAEKKKREKKNKQMSDEQKGKEREWERDKLFIFIPFKRLWLIVLNIHVQSISLGSTWVLNLVKKLKKKVYKTTIVTITPTGGSDWIWL